MVTETDDVRAALGVAADRWPDLTPAELLRRLIAEGLTALRTSETAERAAVRRTSGVLTGVYAPDELTTLREEWPA